MRLKLSYPSQIKRRVSPKELLKITSNQRESIKAIRFVPPVIGRKRDFGSFVVEFENGPTTTK